MTQAADQTPLRIAVVGHTNVGKTSLLRTLLRDASFGDVASSPGTTRVVEQATLPVGDSALVFFDTPGLEDSAGLLSHLKSLVEGSGFDWVEAIAGLSNGAQAARFEQEAKALRQVLESDLLFYVIDVRDKVRAKHRDELEILMRCARPIVAVLNFVAQSKGGEASWRETLARTNIHSIALFDTVAYDEDGEIALYEKARTLHDDRAHIFDLRLNDIRAVRVALQVAGAGEIASMIADIGSLRHVYLADDEQEKAKKISALKSEALSREKACTRAMLKLFRFNKGDYLPSELSIEHGEWQDDPFDPEVLARFGLNMGKAAATGAAVGLGVDILVGGLTLGAAAATGAVVGTGIDALRRYGRDIQERFSGKCAVKLTTESLSLIAARQISLLRALNARGHGAQGEIVSLTPKDLAQPILPYLKKSLSTGLNKEGQQDLVKAIRALL